MLMEAIASRGVRSGYTDLFTYLLSFVKSTASRHPETVPSGDRFATGTRGWTQAVGCSTGTITPCSSSSSSCWRTSSRQQNGMLRAVERANRTVSSVNSIPIGSPTISRSVEDVSNTSGNSA